MDSRFVRGAQPPPVATRRFYPVLRPGPNEPVKGTFLGASLLSWWCHDKVGETRKDFRTVPCYFPCECAGCAEQLPWRWWAFGTFWTAPEKSLVIVQTTLVGAEQICKLAKRAGQLRGLTVEIGKSGHKNTGAFIVAQSARFDRDVMPDDFPIGDSVKRLWGVNQLPEALGPMDYMARGGAEQ